MFGTSLGIAYTLLLSLLCFGFALYDAGYGVCETVFQSFYKRVTSFLVSLTAFVLVVFCTNLLPLPNLPSLVLNFALLTVLTHIVTAMSKSIAYSCAMSAVVGGLLYPILYSTIQVGGLIERTGFTDYIGSGVVHFVGAIIAFSLSVYFSKIGDWRGMTVKNPALASLGFLFIWAAWLLFTVIVSAPLLHNNPMAWMKGLVNVTTTTAWGAVSSVVFTWIVLGKAKLRSCTVGGLAGLVIVSATPFTFTFVDSLTFGVGAGVLAATATYILREFDLRDPCSVIAIHGPAGIITLLAVPLVNHDVSIYSQVSGMMLLTAFAVSAAVVLCEVTLVITGAIQLTKLKNPN